MNIYLSFLCSSPLFIHLILSQHKLGTLQESLCISQSSQQTIVRKLVHKAVYIDHTNNMVLYKKQPINAFNHVCLFLTLLFLPSPCIAFPQSLYVFGTNHRVTQTAKGYQHYPETRPIKEDLIQIKRSTCR